MRGIKLSVKGCFTGVFVVLVERFESCRGHNEDTIRFLANEGCHIIICATRTEGKTVKKVDQIANEFDYNTLWFSSYWSPSLNSDVLKVNDLLE